VVANRYVTGMPFPRAKLSLLFSLFFIFSSPSLQVLTPERSGKAGTNYVVANRYMTGTPFPRAKLSRPPAEVEEEEELCDLEKERLANMKRNQELLRQLGLA
jgi:hypothetical protein